MDRLLVFISILSFILIHANVNESKPTWIPVAFPQQVQSNFVDFPLNLRVFTMMQSDKKREA